MDFQRLRKLAAEAAASNVLIDDAFRQTGRSGFGTDRIGPRQFEDRPSTLVAEPDRLARPAEQARENKKRPSLE